MPIFIKKILALAILLIKEQLKEPFALIWTLLSPGLMFYFLLLSSGGSTSPRSDYIDYSAYYYAYVSASVALFGFALYLVGRRESGFLRSFAYLPAAKAILLAAQLLACSFVAALYCVFLYIITRPLFGPYEATEFFSILARFYVNFLIFCSGALVLIKIPLSFQNANTSFSALLFLMLAILITARFTPYRVVHIINRFNPLSMASEIMSMDGASLLGAGGFAVIFLSLMMWAAVHMMPINPVWSRY